MAERRMWEDPKLARTLSRGVWLLLVASFVLLTKFRLPEEWRWVGPVALVAVVALLLFPTALGLYKSQQHVQTKAYRVLAFALLAKILATGWVVWLVR